MVEEVDGLQLLAEQFLLLVSHILERGAIPAHVIANELHDALASHDIAAEAADNVYHVLRIVLQAACALHVAGLPGIQYARQHAAVIVRSAADAAQFSAIAQAALWAAHHGEAGQDGLVLTVEHVILAVLVATATVELIEALKGVLDTRIERKAPLKAGIW